ncbi:MAG: HEAT repeat domain-containing protein, partial [Planctomycetes bacterium]|nr:HEAT repeat domain-containing protein [Planctomycetota bacterium]
SPAPDTVWVGMLQEDNTPCYRAAAAYALGRIGKRSATDVLMKILGNMDNALDVRHASAIALRRIADDSKAQAIARLAADYPDVSVKQVLLSMSRRD